MHACPTAPYASLTPDRILDALDSVGMRGDGRLLALNSYENRVYLVYCDDAPPVVVKFYRPARWSDAQIVEEHAFVAELAEREIPAVAPLVLDGRTLHHDADLRFAVYPKHGGRTPELDDPRHARPGSAASSAASTRSARSRRSRTARRSTSRPSATSRATSCWRTISCPPTCARRIDAFRPWRWPACATASRAQATCTTLRLHGDCHASNVLWTRRRAALRRLRRRAHRTGGAGPVDAACPAIALR